MEGLMKPQGLSAAADQGWRTVAPEGLACPWHPERLTHARLASDSASAAQPACLSYFFFVWLHTYIQGLGTG